ncbi:NAD(P)/FAD-dependent oxidoreductase [Denitromonas iodatirespirans]|uniref:FAD-dependent oxidoreductase n=1 Tax=Denitromonas iodatirespirans TaxID=2795389 RepID=A0A944H7G0_DENI1|nr:NAD(P)/FAD-dependent oxidoreductase [Denitromonas iodatirespirans]MBT0961193.1 FAD-dependent oxidoreductase [Denitromonas iodatirespirans]
MIDRRHFLTALGATTAAAALPGCASLGASARKAHVVVVGGGFGGASAAKYLRLWSDGRVRVTLVERNARFISCPMSNLVIGGLQSMAHITHDYAGLRDRHGVRLVHDSVTAIDTVAREVRLAGGERLHYDRLLLSPGIDFMTEAVEGLAGHEDRIPHAWKAGEQTLLLHRQLAAMPEGGVFAIHIPKAPFRCPPGPYERASLVADYCLRHKPRAKVLVLDANADIQSKKGLFLAAWKARYPNMIEYRPNNQLLSVDAATRTARLEFEDVKADVLNVIPPQRAGRVADLIGSHLANGRWVPVNWLTTEVADMPNVHVIGDAALPAPRMPKSGHMANQQAKVAAAAILQMLADQPPNPAPMVMNTCYSFVGSDSAMHVASVHRFDAAENTFLPVEGAGGLSAVASPAEAAAAQAWARNIWADTLG